MFGASFFIGHVIGTCFLARYGDILGRTTMLRIALPLTSLIFGLIVFMKPDIYRMYGLIFALGIMSNLRVNISFIYGQEIVKEDLMKYVGTAFNFVDSFTMVVAAIYFKWISKDWIPFMETCFATTVVAAVAVFILPESPKYLLHQGQYKKAKNAFNFIAWMNMNPGIDRHESVREAHPNTSNSYSEHHIDVSLIDMEDKGYRFRDLLRVRVFFVNLLVMNLAWSASSFNYYMIGYYFKYIPGDIYLNVMYAGIAESIVTLFTCLAA